MRGMAKGRLASVYAESLSGMAGSILQSVEMMGNLPSYRSKIQESGPKMNIGERIEEAILEDVGKDEVDPCRERDRARAKEAMARQKRPVSSTSTSSDDTTEEPVKDFEEDKRRKNRDGTSQPMEDSEEESYSASASASRVGRDEAQEKINMDAKRDHEAREEKIEKDRLWREEMAKASREREEEAGVREVKRRRQGDARGTFAGHPWPPQDHLDGGY